MPRVIKGITIPVNRAEGDLEIKIDMTDGVITDAWSSGTMYRGFETMMTGRGALDGLVITPRVCGICSLTHLSAAVNALDIISESTPPDNAIRLRNLSLMAETIQSDMRQSILMFMADFTNSQAYQHHFLFEEATKKYQPLKGTSVMDVVKKTRRLIEIIAIIGGQWPHTSFMVPGGVTSIPDTPKLMQCRLIVEQFRNWYESRVLGCSIERWQDISNLADLYEWLDEKPEHSKSDVGFFLRFAFKAGLDTFGTATENYISFGNLPFPAETTISEILKKSKTDLYDNHTPQSRSLISAGFAKGTTLFPLEPEKIREDISSSWFKPSSSAAHPFEGETIPYASGNSSQRYSWVKAPRYDNLPSETGPLAEMIIDGEPLFHDMIKNKGATTLTRQLARMVRPAKLLPAMTIWLNELMHRRNEPFYTSVKNIPDGQGAGMLQAARGALGHWVKTENQKIAQYQIITPTSWNASPRDSGTVRGPWETALIGTSVKSIENPVEAGHVIRSFDPCMVCAVHTLRKNSNNCNQQKNSFII
ncbi:Ni,Fe-hydrogenase I large subunit [Desulfamplus magnetovallimortis]|uniref:Ni,Fe-hydrogenase I large subunit n=1 Tax=Desulfamplus magnetovallimortis TaxID=1246637 RepID=A0A1W1HIG9_9BACT|nr:nickel-dependent hydrogenase large subunit [Desulfamplus magnetovallimortis]SLM32240.1 Ni,Fe-hydrogenase I large subunit [Desulfamplus magnetovallimortis]